MGASKSSADRSLQPKKKKKVIKLQHVRPSERKAARKVQHGSGYQAGGGRRRGVGRGALSVLAMNVHLSSENLNLTVA